MIYNDLLKDVLHYVSCEDDDVAAIRQDFYRKFKVPPDVIMKQAKQPPVKKSGKKECRKKRKKLRSTNAGQVISAETVQNKTIHNNINYANQGLEVEPNH